MRLVLFLLPVLASAAITNVRMGGVTATQGILQYTAPDQTACSMRIADKNQNVRVSTMTWSGSVVTVTTRYPHSLVAGSVIYIEGASVSQWNGWQTVASVPTVSTFTFSNGTTGSSSVGSIHPLIHDVNTALFSGADLDSRAYNITRGRARTFVIGKRAAEVAADGVRYSRALQRDSEHFYEITCGADSATGTFRTMDWPMGVTYNDGFPTDPTTPGQTAWPKISWHNRYLNYIDPQTGTLLRRLSFPTHSKIGAMVYDPLTSVYGEGTNWTTPENATADDGNSATYSGSTQDVLILRTEWIGPASSYVEALQARIKACVADGATGADRDVEVNITVDGLANPYFASWKTITLLNEASCSAATQTVGDTDPPPIGVMNAWVSGGEEPPTILDMMMATGRMSTLGSVGKHLLHGAGVELAGESDVFGAKWKANSPVYVCDDTTVPCTTTYTKHLVASLQSTGQWTSGTSLGTNAVKYWKAPHFGLLIRKKTTSTHQIRVQHGGLWAWVSQGQKLNQGSGSSTQCSSKLRAAPNGDLGYHCATTNNAPSSWHVYWINPKTGDSIYRGPIWTYEMGTWPLQVFGQTSVAWDSSDPTNDIIYGLATTTSGNIVAIKGVLDDVIVDLGPLDSAGSGTLLQWTWTNLTVEPNHLRAKVQAFDATYDTSFGMDLVGFSEGKIFFSSRGGPQDTAGWNIVFDPATQSVVGAMASWKQAPARWCGIHSSFIWNTMGRQISVGKELRGENNNPYSGPYQTTITSTLSAGATQGNCETLAPGHPFGTLGNKCSSVPVASDDPLSTGIPTNHSLGLMKVGDVFRILGTSSERVRIIAKSGTSLVIQRSFALDYNPIAHSSGTVFRAFCSMAHFPDWNETGEPEDWLWWDFAADPHATNTGDPYGQNLSTGTMSYERAFASMSHPTGRGPITISDQSSNQPACPAIHFANAPYGIREGAWPDHVFSTNIYCINGNPMFAGQVGNGHGNSVEKHVSYDQLDPAAPEFVRKWFIDARPLNTYQDFPQTVTGNAPISGQLYEISAIWPTSVDLKRAQIAVKSGDRIAHDVTAPPPFEITDGAGDSFKFCKAYLAGWCRSGSTAGRIYANIPLAQPLPDDFPSYAGEYKALPKGSFPGHRSLAVVLLGAHADAITQYELRGKHDYSGVSSRRITNVFNPPFLSDKLWNTHPFPDGSWTLATVNRDWFRTDIMLAKVGPLPAESSVNRADFVPIQRRLATVPPGTNNVLAEFADNASMTSCMGVAEPCVSAASNAPYWFSSEAPTGISCAAGCDVPIPALPQRVVYYRIRYRNASNVVIATSAVEVIATP